MKNKQAIKVIIGVVLLIVALIVWSRLWGINKPPSEIDYPAISTAETYSDLEIMFIDVGQADSILVSCHNEYMLVDGGNVGDSDVVYTVLHKKNVSELKYVLLSHDHEDHVGGLPAAFIDTKVGAVYANTDSASTKCFQNFMKRVNGAGLKVIVPKEDVELMLGDARVQILVPTAEFMKTNEYKKNPNNQSLVVKITHGSNTILLTGDCELEEENDLLHKYENTNTLKDIDLLKVGHHGSDTATSVHWLETVLPKYAVISCGEGNKYGHPHQVTLDKLKQAEVNVYRTDLLGDIYFRSDGKELWYVAQE